MNIQNIMSQIKNATNPMQMMMNVLNPSQQQSLNQFKTMNKEQQAEEIARICNSKGITKEELQNMINSFKGM